MADEKYDVVVVGAGVVGALVAKVLTEAGKRVLILEAGRAIGLTDEYRSYETYKSNVDYFQRQAIKIPNSPYPPNPSAPSPYATDNVPIAPGTPDMNGYWVQMGPYPFMSSYLREEGGTTLHWMGSCPRLFPNDFHLEDTYGVGQDWPISYDDLQPFYCEAEWAVGVAGDRKETELYGSWFPEGYDYPMEPIPSSYLDQALAKKIEGKSVSVGGSERSLRVTNLPVARNSTPRRFPKAKGKPGGAPPWDGYQPQGAVGAPHVGQRCEGNSSCTPICPVQAKYNALKTLSRLDPGKCTIATQCVVTGLDLDENGRIRQVNYQQYDQEGLPGKDLAAQGTLYVLAAAAVENAKILLASGPQNNISSGLANSSDQLGRNLMDHPYFLTWALAPEDVGSFRGPGYTSGIPTFLDGEFRKQFAAFRIDVGNWGWNFSAFSPFSDVTHLISADPPTFGRQLREALGNTVPRQMRLGFQIEQLPHPGNRVTISEEFKDASGNYRPVISYDVGDYTWDAMLAAIEVSDRVWDLMGVPRNDSPEEPTTRFHLGQVNPKIGLFAKPPPTRPYKETELGFYGAGHLVGTHRMGSSKTDSVVTDTQRSWDHENLYIVGCGSHPTMGTSNPTITAAALAIRSAKHMLSQLP